MQLISFFEVFTSAEEAPARTLRVPQRIGNLPKGRYSFRQCFCVEKPGELDTAVIAVYTSKRQKPAALIRVRLTPAAPGPRCYPALEGLQAKYAPALLHLFSDMLARDTTYLAQLREYQARFQAQQTAQAAPPLR